MTDLPLPIKPVLTGNLLSLAAAYCDHAGVNRKALGYRLAKDREFFERLDAGHDLRAGTYDLITAHFSDAWPADLAWPEDIPRPSPIPVPKDRDAIRQARREATTTA